MTDLDYFRRRVEQEEKAACTATTSEAEMIHRALASDYERRARSEMLKLLGKTPASPS